MNAQDSQFKAALRNAIIVTAVVTLLSYVLPYDWAASGVGACFFGFTYLFVLRHDSATIESYGLSLGGLFEAAPLRPGRMLREAGVALAIALGLGLLIFPPFWVGYIWWWKPMALFTPRFGASLGEDILGHVLIVALPEEMFYRGYLQSELDRILPPKLSLWGAKVGPGLVLSSAIFALGHFATATHPSRFAVFFPSLLFGWLRARSGGIGAAVFFHALCNLFAAFLGRSYALIP